MTRAAVYTRFSTDRQRDASTEDQLRVCRKRIDAEGWQLVNHFADEAISGSVADRPGYRALLAAAAAGEFDVLVVDDLARLGRDQVERETIIRRFEFRGIRIIGMIDGYDSKLKARKVLRTIHNLKDELELDVLRERVHRGLTGQALKQFSAGGKTYGYRPVPVLDSTRVDVHGSAAVLGYRREIHPEQAEIVREIFARYADGESMLAIASDLNARGVPSPGSTWNRKVRRKDGRWLVSTLHAILHNELYVGRYIWNRREWIRDPDTRKRTSRERPRSEWIVHEIPELAIVDERIWERVQARLGKGAQAFASAHRKRGRKPKYILSGLLECGLCGSKLIVTGSANRAFYRCGTHHGGGEHACANDRTVRRDLAEELLLEPLRREVLEDEAVEYVLRAVRKMWLALQTEPVVDRRPELLKLEAAIAELERLVRTGVLSPAIAGAALERARKEHARLLRAQERVPVAAGTEILFRAEQAYRACVARLREALNGPEVGLARELLRPLVGGSVRCVPAEHGRHLIAELGLDHIALLEGSAVMDKLVAGARYGSIHRPALERRALYHIPLVRRIA